MVNHFRTFKAGNQSSEFLEATLVTSKRTRVQIMVTKRNRILEKHLLVLGLEGVCEGRFRGARSWGYMIPAGSQGKDLEVAIFVHTLAGGGEPIRYEKRPWSDEYTAGFRLTTSQIR